MKYFDAHTHVNFAAYKDDYRVVIQRALDLGAGLVNVGTQLDTSLRALEIAREFQHEPVFATIGLHPVHTEKSYHDEDELGGFSTDLGSFGFTSRGEVFDFETYKKLALDPKVVAIGECGLDYYRIEHSSTSLTTDQESGMKEGWEDLKKKQKEAFLAHIELAHEVRKPLMIHCRAAYEDVISILKDNRMKLNSVPGIIHFFAGSVEDAQEFLDLGFYFTFGGVITFTRDYDEVVRYVPMDRILTETDAPYVTPVPYRGKRNEPSYVLHVVKKLSDIKGLHEDEAMVLILKNARQVFPLVL